MVALSLPFWLPKGSCHGHLRLILHLSVVSEAFGSSFVYFSLFEAATLSDFNVCCEDDYFKELLIHNAMKPTATVVNILIDYAERELI